jgi:hypothetical protein
MTTPTLSESEPVPEPTPILHRRPRRRRWLWQSHFSPAFWTITGILSLVVNIILIVTLILVGQELFTVRQLVLGLVDGLHGNFVKMDQAHIQTTIQVSAQIPVTFNLPVKTNTTVILTEDTNLPNTNVSLSTGGLTITNAPANITLPAGTRLPIALDITVPVSAMVPVQIPVAVDIPLELTELHEPFVGLQNVVKPYQELLAKLPTSWDDVFRIKK